MYNGPEASAQALLRRTAHGARLLLRAYAGCAVLTCTLWLLFPVLRRIAGHSVEFPFWTGLQTDPPLVSATKTKLIPSRNNNHVTLLI